MQTNNFTSKTISAGAEHGSSLTSHHHRHHRHHHHHLQQHAAKARDNRSKSGDIEIPRRKSLVGDEMPTMAPRCSATATASVLLVLSAVVLGLAAAPAETGGKNARFRLDFSPFATFDVPRGLIHPRNRGAAALGEVKSRRAAAADEVVEEKRDPCYSVVVKLGHNNEVKITSRAKGLCEQCCLPKQSRDLRFLLFSKEKRNGAVISPQMKPGAAAKAGVRAELPTVIFIHGFSEISPGSSGKTIVDAYLSRPEDHNIILLDWSELSAFPWYREAVANVKMVAGALTKFLEMYHDTGEIPIDNVHIVGFSLGAHVAGFAGKSLRPGLRVKRITGLDPAFPDFSLKNTRRRLCETDAEYVDVIHTDSGILGFPRSLGHADFYPNGGKAMQPGCSTTYTVDLAGYFACSHIRAWQYYAESVKNPMAFPASQCKSWKGKEKQCNFSLDTYMGMMANETGARGQYYLETNEGVPFGRSMRLQME